jgi:hypothetical protein
MEHPSMFKQWYDASKLYMENEDKNAVLELYDREIITDPQMKRHMINIPMEVAILLNKERGYIPREEVLIDALESRQDKYADWLVKVGCPVGWTSYDRAVFKYCTKILPILREKIRDRIRADEL